MKPYYSHKGIVIYHGDCRDIVPQLDQKIDCIITDPPYGINYQSRKLSNKETRCSKTKYEQIKTTGDNKKFDPNFLLDFKVPTILFGANYYSSKLPDLASWIVWDKRKDPKFYGKNTFADCELIWCSDNKPARMYQQIWNGIIREGEESGKKDTGRKHPMQKPVRLMQYCVNRISKRDQLILDPFMGSGTTLLAAKRLQRKAIGIEIEESYCEIAAKRLSQEVFEF